MPRQKPCNLQDCPARWWAGEWQECSTTCGPSGEKKRTVLCIRTVGSDEQTLPPENCNHLTKLKSYISCNRDVLCPSNWSVSTWTECSVTCGGGIRTRNVTCARYNNQTCDPSKKPNSKALCGLQQCQVQKRLLLPPKIVKPTIKIIPKTTDGSMKRLLLLKKNLRFPSTTKVPNKLTSTPPALTQSPLVNSIEDDFQIYDIPNSTHFNVIYKYNFALVANNKKKVTSNSTSVPANKNGTKADYEIVLNATTTTSSSTHDDVTPTYNFLTQQPKTQTGIYGTDVPTTGPDTNYDTEMNNIIESRSKRHKGKSKVTVENFSTVMYQPESSTLPLLLMTTDIPESLNTISDMDVVIADENTSKISDKEEDPFLISPTEPDELTTARDKVFQDLPSNLNRTSKGKLITSLARDNVTELPINKSSNVSWIVGNWSECSTTCGLGAFWRNVECSTSNERDCKHIKKPDPARRCHLRPCASWRTGNWSKCSTNCGAGFMTREVQCVDIRENRPLRPFHCQLPGQNPVQNATCKAEPCLSWLAKPWSPCSKTCGNGVRQREVFCPKENRCDLKKRPAVLLNCSQDPCVSWQTSNWTECSTTCGDGTQHRIVQCIATDNNRTVNHSHCNKDPKPQETKECHIQDCTNISGDLEQLNQSMTADLHTDAPCTKDKLSINFCNTMKSIGKCSSKAIQLQCCFTCARQEESLQDG